MAQNALCAIVGFFFALYASVLQDEKAIEKGFIILDGDKYYLSQKEVQE